MQSYFQTNCAKNICRRRGKWIHIKTKPCFLIQYRKRAFRSKDIVMIWQSIPMMTIKPSLGNISAPYLLAIINGALSSILGVSVLIGWFTHNVTLMQVSAAFVPMQFNTALGFLLSGLGLLVVIRGSRGVGTACGIFVMLIGLLTLAEYIFGFDLGINQLLMKH